MRLVLKGGSLRSQGAIDPGLAHFADKLLRIKHKLEKLELTQAWSLRETDLYDFSVTLVDMDDRRVGQKFPVEDGSTPDEGQSVGLASFAARVWSPLTNCCQIVLYLLRRSYAHIYTLMVSSEV